MKTSTAIRIGLTVAAALYPPMILAAEVTLYAPDRTPTDVYISRTGDYTVKPVSTAASGQTAYEVQFNVTGAVAISPSTTSSFEGTTFPATTYTLLADASKVNVAHTVGAGPNEEDVFISESECIRHDDGNFVCEEKGELIRVDASPDSTSTTRSSTFTTYTAPAQAWYTIQESESGAASLSVTSGGSAIIMGVFTSLGFAAGLLLV